MKSSSTKKQTVNVGMAEAAKILSMPRTTLAYHVKTGKVNTIGKLPGTTGAYLFDREYIESLAADASSKA